MVSTGKFFSCPEVPSFMNGVIQKESIKIAVHVIIKECGLCTKSREIKSIFVCLIHIYRNAILIYSLTHQKLVMTVQHLVFPDPRNINVKQSIIINIHH